MASTELVIAETDLPIIIADVLTDTDVVQRSLSALGRFFIEVPLKLASWLGPELRTPGNSPPPRFIPGEAGPWNGVVFVEQDDPRYWVLVAPTIGSQPTRYSADHAE